MSNIKITEDQLFWMFRYCITRNTYAALDGVNLSHISSFDFIYSISFLVVYTTSDQEASQLLFFEILLFSFLNTQGGDRTRMIFMIIRF